MKKSTITITFDEEKIAALKMYLENKNTQIENELEKALDILYTKNVPSVVRDFIDMKSGEHKTIAAPKQRKQKTPSAVGAEALEPNTEAEE